jgi:hypothetical protein
MPTSFIRVVTWARNPETGDETVSNIQEWSPERTKSGNYTAGTIHRLTHMMEECQAGHRVQLTHHVEYGVRLPPQPPQSMRNTLALCRMIKGYRAGVASAAHEMVAEMRTKALDLGEGRTSQVVEAIRALGYTVELY